MARNFNSVTSNALGALNSASNIVSGAASIMAFFGRDPSQWDIVEADYEGIKFHVFESKKNNDTNQTDITWKGALPKITDSGGRRVVKYTFPYTDGQTTDDLGRKPETFELDIIFFGEDYKSGYQALFNKLQVDSSGTLMHPVRGKVQCRMEDYEVTHSNEANRSLSIRLKMVEHSFSLTDFQTPKRKVGIPSSFANALSTLLGAFQTISNAIGKVQGAILFATHLKAALVNALANFELDAANFLANMNAIFGPTDGSTPGIKPVNETGTAKSTTGGFGAETIQQRAISVISPNDPAAKIPLVLLQPNTLTALAITSIKNQAVAVLESLSQIVRALKEAAPIGSPSNSGVQVSGSGKFVLSGVDNDGALEFYDTIQALKIVGINIQLTLEAGLRANSNVIIKYTVPRLMTIREVAFANSISPDHALDISLLNTELHSLNYIPQGTVLLVPR